MPVGVKELKFVVPRNKAKHNKFIRYRDACYLACNNKITYKEGFLGKNAVFIQIISNIKFGDIMDCGI